MVCRRRKIVRRLQGKQEKQGKEVWGNPELGALGSGGGASELWWPCHQGHSREKGHFSTP